MDGLGAAGLSQLTSLNLEGEWEILLSWVGQGAAVLVPQMKQLQQCEDGWLTEMLGG